MRINSVQYSAAEGARQGYAVIGLLHVFPGIFDDRVDVFVGFWYGRKVDEMLGLVSMN